MRIDPFFYTKNNLIYNACTLSEGRKIDKSYGHDQFYDVHTLHSGNLYQIYTYVKNLDREKNGSVSGMLLYARTDEMVLPDNVYHMGGNPILVKSLDLDCDLSVIREQLDEVAHTLDKTEAEQYE